MRKLPLILLAVLILIVALAAVAWKGCTPDGQPPPPAAGAPAVLPPPLPPPPPTVPGCYVYTPSGWESTRCATEEEMRRIPHPDAQLTVASTAVPKLVFGEVAVTLPRVQSEVDVGRTGGRIRDAFTVQTNSNPWPIASIPGHSAAVQFVVHSDGNLTTVCIWNIDITVQAYARECTAPSPMRSGGLVDFDNGNVAGFVNAGGTLTIMARTSWAASGTPSLVALVGRDAYGLANNWTSVSGTILGYGNGSSAEFRNAEVFTTVLASTCPGDTEGTSPVCPPPTLQPNATARTGFAGTSETNNLVAIGTPTVSYPNVDLVVTNLMATDTGACLGPSHAYVRDTLVDYGATPSTVSDPVFWESPDIVLVPRGTPVNLDSVSTETLLSAGGAYDLWVRVHNEPGCTAVTNARAMVYIADPGALSVQWLPITGSAYVGPGGGATGVNVPAQGRALIGPLPFTAPATGLGSGHKCILAAIQATGEAPPASTFDAPASNQVAQRNIQISGPLEYALSNASGSAGDAQITLSLSPPIGTAPSLTADPDVEVQFDDADASWWNAWKAQAGSGKSFAATHSGNTTTVRLGAYSVKLDPVPLAAGEKRNAAGSVTGSGPVTLRIAAALTDPGHPEAVRLRNGGSFRFQGAPLLKGPHSPSEGQPN
jgi:hypothetical protein